MRTLAVIFALLILVLQYPMWLGKGGWLQVRELDRQIRAQRQVDEELKARNAALDAEVLLSLHARFGELGVVSIKGSLS